MSSGREAGGFEGSRSRNDVCGSRPVVHGIGGTPASWWEAKKGGIEMLFSTPGSLHSLLPLRL